MFTNARYLRQIILPEIGIDGQEKINNSKVLCIGLGGLGSSAVIHLASSGVGTIGIVDYDVVDISNLNRQIIFNIDNIGKKKAYVASLFLKSINPDISVIPYDFKLDHKNIEDLFNNYDVIIDATDNLKSKFLINDYAVKLNKPMIYSSLFNFEGHLSVFYSKKGPCYRCIYKEEISYVPNCSEYGVLGPIAGIMGTWQALEAIKFILSFPYFDKSKFNSLISKLLIFNFKNLSFNLIDLKKSINCFCKDYINKLDVNLNHNNSKIDNYYIYLSDIDKISNFKLIDIRDDLSYLSKFTKNHEVIKTSFFDLISLNFINKLSNKDCLYIIYCEYGIRSKLACNFLRLKGINNVFYLRY